MDFKYIEQLLERYFAAETSLQEEQLLRDFFAQDEVPAHLRQWQPLFRAEKAMAEAHLDEQFDRKMLQLIGEEHVQAQRITLSRRLRPLFKAAAFVAFAIVLGTAVEQASSLSQGNASQENFRAAFEGEDELDATETTVIDIRSAIAEPADSTVNLSH